jgi:hypothetical protein
MDHNEAPNSGHDIYDEGLHIDVSVGGKHEVKLDPQHPPLDANRGVVIKQCISYFRKHAGNFVDIYTEQTPPGSPPTWRG